MSSSLKLSQWIEIVVALAVVLSLIFVGFEIRQNTKLARGQARQALVELNQEWLVLMSSEEYNTLFQKVWGTDQEITESEHQRDITLMLIHLRRFENVYFQFKEGFVDQFASNSYGLQILEGFNSTRFQQFWKVARTGIDPKFVEFFEDKVGL